MRKGRKIVVTRIPFNKPFIVGKELYYISQAVFEGHLAGDGAFTKKCHEWLEERFGAKKVLLTHSCTAALEMAAILSEVEPGDEVIMPSFTFVSTANAFALRGARIRFVDIRDDTLNIDETLIEDAITPRTRVVVPVHYAGVAAEMDTILEIADRHDVIVVEDAAQGVNATYKGRYLGTIGHFGTYSFHETKNFISGEGGALLVNDEPIRRKGRSNSGKGHAIAPSFFAARWTSTPGWIWVRRISHRKSWRLFCMRNSRKLRRLRPSGGGSFGVTRNSSSLSSRPARSGFPPAPSSVFTTHICFV